MTKSKSFKKLNTLFNEKYYKSDDIEIGRIIKKFFSDLSENIFNQSCLYNEKNDEYEECSKYPYLHEFPLVFMERNLYSLVAVAINKITPIHLSEWAFSDKESNKKPNIEETDKGHGNRVDFWCLDKKPKCSIDYFIELKKAYYCMNNNNPPNQYFNNQAESLISQIHNLKKKKVAWHDISVHMGLLITHGYYHKNKKPETSEIASNKMLETAKNLIDKRSGIQLLSSTLVLNENDEKYNYYDEEEKVKGGYGFINIIGFVISKKR